MANISIYPPIIDTYMPAFNIHEGCRVYFALSDYNVIQDYQRKLTQVIVSSQFTNKNMLSSKHPFGIKITDVYLDTSRSGADKWFIKLDDDDIDGGFQLNQYYKVQIRFTSSNLGASAPQSVSWFNTNLDEFSEWSTVCLIKGIEPPQIKLYNFLEPDSMDNVPTFKTDTIAIMGEVQFGEGESETLKSYQIKTYQGSQLIADSDTLYPDKYGNVNGINYTIPRSLENSATLYHITISALTRNLYEIPPTDFYFMVKLPLEGILDTVTVIANPDYENACVCINIERNAFEGNLIIRRTSSKTNFDFWEDVHIATFKRNDGIVVYTWRDFTIESGVWYKYAIQRGVKYTNYIQRSTSQIIPIKTLGTSHSVMNNEEDNIITQDKVMMVFEHIYLVGNNRQLKIKYDPNISSFRYATVENKTETIGSKYPFIRKNGDVNYREFPISGLITILSDEDELFVAKDTLYQHNSSLYNNSDIDDLNFITEKLFRDEVMTFLYDGKPKLFRSAQEGNMIVCLMGTTLTPNQQLSRLIYSFSCTASEVMEDKIKYYDQYNIQSMGEFLPAADTLSMEPSQIIRTYQSFGQVNTYTGAIGANVDIIDLITEEERHQVYNNNVIEINKFYYLRIEFNNAPYKIKQVNGIPKLANNSDTNNVFLGYLMYINNKPIAINKEGIYELENNDDGFEVNTFSVATNSDVIINYIADISEKTPANYSATSPAPVPTPARTVIQRVENYSIELTNFLCGDSIMEACRQVINQQVGNTIKTLLSIESFTVHAEPGTYVAIRTQSNGPLKERIVNITSQLDWSFTDDTLYDFFFRGYEVYSDDIDVDKLARENGQWTYDGLPALLFKKDSSGIKFNEIVNNSNLEPVKSNPSNYNLRVMYAVQNAVVTITYTEEVGTI